MTEEIKPNIKDCGGCKWFIKAGSRIADRFPVKIDTCVQQNYGRACICLAKALLDPDPDTDSDLIEVNSYTR